MQNTLLSIIIISHNQRSELKRCVDSVLAQNIPFEYEIILSDDRSTDGSFELAQEYAQQYHDLIQSHQCDSNLCNPAMTSERAGYNRINALKHARGKYLIHVDGDDFYIGDSVFAKQVELLENNPSCTICCQNYSIMYEKNNFQHKEMVYDKNLFEYGKQISVDEFINTFPYIHNSACCLRNDHSIDVDKLSEYMYDDVDITFQYIANGKIILADSCDFIYVNYNKQTASKFERVDQKICWLTPVTNAIIAPQCVGSLFYHGFNRILDVINCGLKQPHLNNNTIRYLSKINANIFKAFNNSYSFNDVLRLQIIRTYMGFMIKFNLKCDLFYKILYILVVSKNIPANINFKRLI